MNKKFKKSVNKYITWIIILMLIPIIIYLFVFSSNGISYNSDDWSNFGSFIGGYSALIFGAANIIFLVKISFVIHKLEGKRNKQNKIDSVKPLCILSSYNSLKDNYITLEIHNNGIGPLIIKEILFEINNISYNDIRTLIEQNSSISNLRPFLRSNSLSIGTSIPSNSKEEIMYLKVDKNSNLKFNEPNVQRAMDRIINEMNKISTTIVYTDIYDSQNFTYRDNFN